MALVSTGRMLLDAQEGHYAVPAFNFENMEMLQAVLCAAAAMKSPVILQTTPGTVRYAGLAMLRAMAAAESQKYDIPVALHLDHGNSLQICREALEQKYTSVMIDGSKLDFEHNVGLTRSVTEAASPFQIAVEGELGTVGGKEDDLAVGPGEARYTSPGQAEEFVRRTGVSSLAVAIGTAHGFYKGEPHLNFDRLREIRQKVSVPIVLHGASGLPDESVRRCVELGCCKVNFATELRAAFTEGVREALKDETIYDPKAFMKPGRKDVEDLVKHKIRVCGSAGRG